MSVDTQKGKNMGLIFFAEVTKVTRKPAPFEVLPGISYSRNRRNSLAPLTIPCVCIQQPL